MKRAVITLIGAVAIALAIVPAGTATARITTSPNTHDFGGQTVGTSSAPFTFTLWVRCYEDPANPMMPVCQNNDPLTPNVTVSGNFAIQNNNCTSFMPGNTLQGTTCTFAVAFVPQIAGARTGIVDVGDPNGFGKALVSGTGLAPVLPVTSTQTPTKPRKCKRRRGGKAAAARKCRRKKR